MVRNEREQTIDVVNSLWKKRRGLGIVRTNRANRFGEAFDCMGDERRLRLSVGGRLAKHLNMIVDETVEPIEEVIA